jgi:hypothetical protein
MSGQHFNSIQERFSWVIDRIHHAAGVSGRNPGDVCLVVVTKGHPIEVVHEAVEAGARYLGENYVEEAVEKIRRLKTGGPVEWHMIGHIQSRKAKDVVENFSYIHSLDSLKLARRLSLFCSQVGKELPVLLECNVTGEETKFGWRCWEQESWPMMVDQLNQLLEIPGITIKGLMTMAPYYADPEQARPAFRSLRQLRDFLTTRVSGVELPELSMGMSGDFEVAIQEGATMVRIGTAILGMRK